MIGVVDEELMNPPEFLTDIAQTTKKSWVEVMSFFRGHHGEGIAFGKGRSVDTVRAQGIIHIRNGHDAGAFGDIFAG